MASTANAPASFAERLVVARAARDISQSELARRAGYDHSFVSRLERGERHPTLEVVERIAKALALSEPATDAMRMAAGFLPRAQDAVYHAAIVGKLDRALNEAPPELYWWTEQSIAAILGHLERASHHD